jgi:hypothetical protein
MVRRSRFPSFRVLICAPTDRERQRTPISDAPPSSATSSSSHSARVFLATPATKPSSESHMLTPRASSPGPSSEPEQAGARERRVRKSINYAEPKLNTYVSHSDALSPRTRETHDMRRKMRKPDPPPSSALKRSSSAAEHAPRRSLETAPPSSAAARGREAQEEPHACAHGRRRRERWDAGGRRVRRASGERRGLDQ